MRLGEYLRLILPVRSNVASDKAPQMTIIRDRIDDQAGKSDSPPLQPVPDAEGRVTLGSSGTPGRGWSASIKAGEPNSGVWKQQRRTLLKRGTADVTMEVSCELTSTPENFHLKESLRAMEGDKLYSIGDGILIKRDLM